MLLTACMSAKTIYGASTAQWSMHAPRPSFVLRHTDAASGV
jgi:hypothetical protein